MAIPQLSSFSGYRLPALGFGTYRLNGTAGVEAIGRAIDNGYTLLDSAFNYDNEGAVGAAVRAHRDAREQLVVTSKLPGRHQRFAAALETVEESVYRTGLDHLDLYLIHWPNPSQHLYVEAWAALIKARSRGLVHEIGVCNFLPEHLERIEAETGVRPVVNQIELHPYFPQTDALAYHREHGILTQAWSPIGRGNDLLSNRTITAIADQHRISAAQTVLAWHVAVGAIPLPKAATQQRQLENLGALDVVLSAAEVAAITALGRPDGRINNQDPAAYEEF
ncbi:aldo/keto reductase [Micromonospora aurantiaca (nom. illeg.)]|uniref:aldo/keto reductase n=1 Tax=Micromonospora aurantiaca (nom. illeg.) TaxID=47850 RepID=UPI003404B6F3